MRLMFKNQNAAKSVPVIIAVIAVASFEITASCRIAAASYLAATSPSKVAERVTCFLLATI